MKHKNIWALGFLAATFVMPTQAQDTLYIVTKNQQMSAYAMGENAYISFSRPTEAKQDTLVRLISQTMRSSAYDTNVAPNDYGIPSMMYIRDIMTDDMVSHPIGYNWYSSWCTNRYLGAIYKNTSIVWKTYDNYIGTTNDVISRLQNQAQTSEVKVALAQARTFRAHAYLEMGQMYEYMPTDVLPNTQYVDTVSGNTNDINHLTVPILTRKYAKNEIYSIPRATKQELTAFIQADLDYAVNVFNNSTTKRESIEMPTLAVAHGLLARLYMWTGDYNKASAHATKAIAACPNSHPLTKSEWTNMYTGFNSAQPAWIWGLSMKQNDLTVLGVASWTSWMSNEYSYGYAGACVYTAVSKALYDHMGEKDFRKLSWLPEDGNPLLSYQVKYQTLNDPEPYISVKFRPGSGINDEWRGLLVDIPLMRVEEMYFIQAEATAHINQSEGRKLLNEFMQQYRDKTYRCSLTSTDDIVKEIVLQKRIELWGEGQSYFDYKRLNIPVTRYYEGSNYLNWKGCFNTKTYPAWMNFVFPTSAIRQNTALEGWNNPDPSELYDDNN